MWFPHGAQPSSLDHFHGFCRLCGRGGALLCCVITLRLLLLFILCRCTRRPTLAGKPALSLLCLVAEVSPPINGGRNGELELTLSSTVMSHCRSFDPWLLLWSLVRSFVRLVAPCRVPPTLESSGGNERKQPRFSSREQGVVWSLQWFDGIVFGCPVC